jgi:PAS domain S-box-containing protein
VKPSTPENQDHSPSTTPSKKLAIILHQLGIDLAACDTLETGLKTCLTAALKASGGSGAGIYLFHPDTRTLELVSHSGLPTEFIAGVLSFGPNTPQVALIETKEAAYFSTQIAPLEDPYQYTKGGFRALAAIPILSQNSAIAALNVASNHPEGFNPQERIALESIAMQIGSAIVRLQLTQQLAQRERQYRALLQNSNDIIFIHEFYPDGTPGKILEASQAMFDFFGITEDQLPEYQLFKIPAPHHKARAREYAKKLITEKEVSFEMEAIRADGQLRCFAIKGRLVDIEGRLIALSLMHDVTERRDNEQALLQSERELRAIAARLAANSESERRAVATELHDGIAQTVTGVRFSLEALIKGLPDNTPEKLLTSVKNALSDLGSISGNVRSIISELRPPTLEHFGLLGALSAYAIRLETKYDTEIEVRGMDNDSFPAEETALGLYRIGMEAISNACQHAKASHILVTLQHDATTLKLCISDNGKGFDIKSRPRFNGINHLGLITMKERALAIAAELQIDTAINQGTRITVSIRLASQDA